MFKYKKINLQKISEKDLFNLLILKNESWEFTHQNTFLNYEDQKDWFENLNSSPNNPKNLILSADSDLTKFGVFKITNIDWINRKADVGWDIFKEFRGHGLGKILVEAGSCFCFEMLNLHRLDAEILENNIASVKCAEHAGFVLEGKKIDCVYKKDTYINSLIYGKLNEKI